MTAQDEQRLKEWFGQLHVLIEGLQAQINSLKEDLKNLQIPTPSGPQTVSVAKQKGKVVVEEPPTVV